jgi:hypothetical protein
VAPNTLQAAKSQSKGLAGTLVRTIAWLAAVLLNGAAAALISAYLTTGTGIPTTVRIFGALGMVMFLSMVALLVLARVGRLPQWGSKAMAAFCSGIPTLWLLGSLDYGRLSGLELMSVIIIALCAWGTWWAFKLFPMSK